MAFASAAWAAAAATAQVEFVKPESFTDAGRRNARVDRESNLEAIRRHLVREAAKRLPAGEALSISITDVDLAGAYEPWQRYSNEIRVVKDIYPPRIDLRFRLARADGSVVKEGERSLRDPGFLMGDTSHQDDNLKYEKAMLDQWMGKEFE
ncbi:MAG TPA: DUF3016 domain-containing protein [Usitatibacter sp.]|nr:DUF3016 domain-containing protein [Usitatibacter sp.]